MYLKYFKIISFSASPPPGSLTFETRPEGQWYHGSDLTCLICQKTFVDFTYYCTHIRTLHQISKEQYNDKYGTAAEAFRYVNERIMVVRNEWRIE
jgi:hypothetical protein